MKLQLEKKNIEKVEMDVRLPIYRRHKVGDYGDTIYSKVVAVDNASLACYSVWLSANGTIELEITPKYQLTSSSDYALGIGMYASSEEQFNAAWAKLMALMPAG